MSQLVACLMTSLPCKPCTRHRKKPHHRSFEHYSSSKCHPEFKLIIDLDNLLDRLWIAAFDLELHAEDRAMGTPKIEFPAKWNLTREISRQSIWWHSRSSYIYIVSLSFHSCSKGSIIVAVLRIKFRIAWFKGVTEWHCNALVVVNVFISRRHLDWPFIWYLMSLS